MSTPFELATTMLVPQNHTWQVDQITQTGQDADTQQPFSLESMQSKWGRQYSICGTFWEASKKPATLNKMASLFSQLKARDTTYPDPFIVTFMKYIMAQEVSGKHEREVVDDVIFPPTEFRPLTGSWNFVPLEDPPPYVEPTLV